MFYEPENVPFVPEEWSRHTQAVSPALGALLQHHVSGVRIHSFGMIQNFSFCFQRQLLVLNNDKTRLCSYYQMLLSALSFDFLFQRSMTQVSLQGTAGCGRDEDRGQVMVGTTSPFQPWDILRSFYRTQQLRYFFPDGF